MAPKRKPMHPRNVFRTPPDYTALAIKYEEFRRQCNLQLNGKVAIDYKSEDALRILTKTLLVEYFDLHVDFAPGSLIPTLPLRLNYILWLEDLVKENMKDVSPRVVGIDIGCGSSCVYSLLAAKDKQWTMFALEASSSNCEFAEQNVKRNHLEDLVTVFEQSNQNVIFKDFMNSQNQNFSFCLCNPPFYDSSGNSESTTRIRNPDKRAPPHNCHTGQLNELYCVGGEVEFVKRIIEEGLLFKHRISIFTSMLGHKSSLSKIVDCLEQNDITNFCSTEFCQGVTTRWGIAWSFRDDIKLKDSI